LAKIKLLLSSALLCVYFQFISSCFVPKSLKKINKRKHKNGIKVKKAGRVAAPPPPAELADENNKGTVPT
jgi:hypothetical protein